MRVQNSLVGRLGWTGERNHEHKFNLIETWMLCAICLQHWDQLTQVTWHCMGELSKCSVSSAEVSGARPVPALAWAASVEPVDWNYDPRGPVPARLDQRGPVLYHTPPPAWLDQKERAFQQRPPTLTLSARSTLNSRGILLTSKSWHCTLEHINKLGAKNQLHRLSGKLWKVWRAGRLPPVRITTRDLGVDAQWVSWRNPVQKKRLRFHGGITAQGMSDLRTSARRAHGASLRKSATLELMAHGGSY
eukprot:1996721-Amphidinium_carterae.3